MNNKGFKFNDDELSNMREIIDANLKRMIYDLKDNDPRCDFEGFDELLTEICINAFEKLVEGSNVSIFLETESYEEFDDKGAKPKKKRKKKDDGESLPDIEGAV